METKLNDELARIRPNFGNEKNAIIADINSISNENKKTISDLAIHHESTCNIMITNLQNETERKNKILLATTAKNMHEAESLVIDDHTSKWKLLRDEMATTHTKMVTANKIAINNSKRLRNISSSAEKKISDLDENILLQSTNINNLVSMMNTTETKMSNIRTHAKHVNNEIKTKIDELINNASTSEHANTTIFPKLDPELEKYSSDRMKQVVDL